MPSSKHKYGSAGFDWGPEKSGFTPLGLDFPGIPSDSKTEEYKRRETIEEFQRGILIGFTVSELTQMDVIPVREMKSCSLKNGIVKLLQPPQWEKTPSKHFSRTTMYSVGNGMGDWTAHNPIIYDILAPILKLASRILQSTDLIPWFDAVLNGERRAIEDWRKPRKLKNTDMWDLQSFHRRPAHEMQNVARDRDDVFEELMTTYNCQFGFMKRHEDPRDSDPCPVGVHGLTYANDFDPRLGEIPQFFVNLCIEDLEPLLANVNSSERMCVEWFIAETLVHEIMHLVYSKWAWHHPPVAEMYFEDEQLMENGFSFANACFGGLVHPMRSTGFPLGFYLQTPWPVQSNAQNCSPADPILKPALDLVYSSYPLPLTLIEDVNQDDFWELVGRQFGHKLLRMRYLKYGLRFDEEGEWENIKRLPFKAERKRLADEVHALSIRDKCSMTPDEIRQLRFATEMSESSTREQAFWDGTLAQIVKMTEFQDMAIGEHIGSNLRQDLLAKVKDAVSHHLQTVIALNNIERYEAHASTQRRKNHLDWNRGTRIFLNGFSDNAFDLKQTCSKLEESRLSLWCPNQPDPDPAPTTDRIEFDLLQASHVFTASQDNETVLQICDRVLQSPSVTLFGRACAGILLAALYWDSSKDTDEEKTKYVIERATILGELKNYGMRRSFDTGWGEAIDAWLRIVLDLRKKVEPVDVVMS